jgi:CDGSH-type Zn-finger protein
VAQFRATRPRRAGRPSGSTAAPTRTRRGDDPGAAAGRPALRPRAHPDRPCLSPDPRDAALCRCGASANKQSCRYGSQRRIDFRAVLGESRRCDDETGPNRRRLLQRDRQRSPLRVRDYARRSARDPEWREAQIQGALEGLQTQAVFPFGSARVRVRRASPGTSAPPSQQCPEFHDACEHESDKNDHVPRRRGPRTGHGHPEDAQDEGPRKSV